MRHLLRGLAAGQYYGLTSRFASGRRAYSKLEAVRQRIGLRTPKPALAPPSVIFAIPDINDYVKSLKIDGIVQGLALPPALFGQINRHALIAPCCRAGVDQTFLKRDVRAASLSTGETVLDAFVQDLDRCEAIDAVRFDAGVFRIAEQYLGYVPTRIEAKLKWSFRSDLPKHVQWERAEGMQVNSSTQVSNGNSIGTAMSRVRHMFSARTSLAPVYYHFDVFGFNALRVYYYITNVDQTCGAHVAIKGSHTRKTIPMLMHSGIYPEAKLLRFFGEDSEVIVEGPAGHGFIEDVTCYHKLLPPTHADRLALSITYF